MMVTRQKAALLVALAQLSLAQHNQLRDQGAQNSKFWTEADEENKQLISRFKDEVKEHYYLYQGRRCCYCSKELDPHKGSYDAEHILDQSTYPRFMFELNNLAVACKSCNGGKSAKHVLAADVDVDVAVVPTQSEHYTIVHPHLDEWADFLCFDLAGRIRPTTGSSKGAETIRICRIEKLNMARLADHFLGAGFKDAEKALKSFTRKNASIRTKQLQVELLRRMANNYGLPQAAAAIRALEEELAEHQGV